MEKEKINWKVEKKNNVVGMAGEKQIGRKKEIDEK